MKFRVKFKCYWYNTGAADNHTYERNEDFDTVEEATAYHDRVVKQIEMQDSKDYKATEEWFNSGQSIEVENGFISGHPQIFKYTPETEHPLIS